MDARADFREASRRGWDHVGPIDAAALRTGALLRLADAVERLCGLLDPAERRARRERERERAEREQERERERAARRPVVDALNAAEGEVKRRLRPLLGPLPAAQRVALLDLAPRRVLRRVERDPWWETPPEAYEAAARAFDPLAYDWAAVKLGPKSRARLEACLAAARTREESDG